MHKRSQAYNIGHAHVYLLKAGGVPETVHALSGELYLSEAGWLLLNVPNRMVRGIYSAIDENGVELPLRDGKLNAHVSVMRPEEIEQIGGPEKITERGKHFHYTLGPMKVVKPTGWPEMSKVWFVTIKSKELEELRKSYGLTPLPHNNEYEFHVTVGVRRKNILRNNEVSKAAGLLPSFPVMAILGTNLWPQSRTPQEPDIYETAVLDDSHLDALRQLAAKPVRPRRKKRVRKPVVQPGTGSEVYDLLNKMSEDQNGLLREEMQGADTSDTHESGSSRDDRIGTCKVDEEALSAEKVRVQGSPQEEDFDCGPAALRGILTYYGADPGRDLGDLTEELGADEEDGTPPDHLIAKAKSEGLEVESKHGMSIDDLKQAVDQGHAVLCPIQAWGTEEDFANSAAGHYVTVTGYDEKNIYFNDPSHKGNGKASLPIPEYERRWHDKDADGRSYVRYGIQIWSSDKETSTDNSEEAADSDEDEKTALFPALKKDKRRIRALPSAIAGLTAGLMLHGPTSTNMPAQVTRFPTKNTVDFIRGMIAPGAPASTVEGTDRLYFSAGDHEIDRVHARPHDLGDLLTKIRKQTPPGGRIGTLEMTGHGSPFHFQLGTGEGTDVPTITKDTVQAVAKRIKEQAPLSSDASIYLNACNSGLCNPSPALEAENPNRNWLQRLAEGTDSEVISPRGFHITPRAGDWSMVSRQFPNLKSYEANDKHDASEDAAWASFHPDKPRERVLDQPGKDSKESYFSMPAQRIMNVLYNIGKPAAIAGTMAPLLENEDAAKWTAVGTSAAAAPMALSEILARFGESQARNEGQDFTTSLQEHLNNQSKALPYLALASLPLLSYGGAKLLGRWDKKKKQQEPADLRGG